MIGLVGLLASAPTYKIIRNNAQPVGWAKACSPTQPSEILGGACIFDWAYCISANLQYNGNNTQPVGWAKARNPTQASEILDAACVLIGLVGLLASAPTYNIIRNNAQPVGWAKARSPTKCTI